MTTSRGVGSAHRWRRRLLRTLLVTVLFVLAITALAGGWLRLQLGRSLPERDGVRALPGLSAPVVVERDALGVPTITGASRLDVARALGFVHAQDRFVQMDLARRRAAGELAELFGPAALAADRASRLHRFRTRARAVVAAASDEERALVEAYAEGVNDGLAVLGASPPEYLLLRASPQPWRAEDTVLVVFTMFLTLQDAGATFEGRAALLRDVFPGPVVDFLLYSGNDWDTLLDGGSLPHLGVPDAEVLDFRAGLPGGSAASPMAAPDDPLASRFGTPEPLDLVLGSNSWAVSGAVTANGRAVVANDMHLALTVPNIWYRASLVWTDDVTRHQLTGVTLPGVPLLIVGSNGSVAWGFTNTEGDWTDRVLVEAVAGDPTRYLTPEGPRAFEVFEERIRIKDADDEVLNVRETIWGPVAPPDHRGRLFAVSWVAHRPGGVNLRLSSLERAGTAAEALDLVPLAGIPAQNFVVADAEGHIGWTVAGRIPRRDGFDGRLPESWADGSKGWHGWYAPGEYPRVVDPPSGRIVTANNRLVAGRAAEMLGDGNYDTGIRAYQITKDLLAISRATARDMLAVQLDDRAVLMERWRAVALDVLTPAAVERVPTRREFRRLVEETWTGRASVDSVGYRLVRQFRSKVTELLLEPFFARVRAAYPEQRITTWVGVEGPIYALVTKRPPHLLDPKYVDWTALLLDALDQSIVALTDDDQSLSQLTWGDANTLSMQHPLSRGLPWLSPWLDMPGTALPGDSVTPRAQRPGHGASERLAVSPGLEAEGYFHMPGGQSGHPLSPHYRDGHAAWVRGDATPFLPGPPVARLELRPGPR